MELILARKLSDSDVARLAEKLNESVGKFGLLAYETSAKKSKKQKESEERIYGKEGKIDKEPKEFKKYVPELGIAYFKEDTWAGYFSLVKLRDLKYLKFGEEVLVNNFELTF